MPLVAILSTFAIRVLGLFFYFLSAKLRVRLGSGIGWLLMIVSKSRRSITRSNIQSAFHEFSSQRIEEVVLGSYQNLGIVLVEFLASYYMTQQEILRCVAFDGFEEVIQRSKSGKPTILLSAHFGNWEILALASGVLLNKQVSIVAHPQSNALIDHYVNKSRTRLGNRVIPMGQAASTLIKTLSSGGIVAFLADQHANPERDPWISFFGKETPTYKAPAALALRYDAQIYCAFAQRSDDGVYQVRVRPLPMDDLENTPDGIRTLTHRHVAVLEQAVRQSPHLWSWQHRRWRGADQ